MDITRPNHIHLLRPILPTQADILLPPMPPILPKATPNPDILLLDTLPPLILLPPLPIIRVCILLKSFYFVSLCILIIAMVNRYFVYYRAPRTWYGTNASWGSHSRRGCLRCSPPCPWTWRLPWRLSWQIQAW